MARKKARKKPAGWRGESERHRQAARGINTVRGKPTPITFTTVEIDTSEDSGWNPTSAQIQAAKPLQKLLVRRLEEGEIIMAEDVEQIARDEGIWDFGPFKGFYVYRIIDSMPAIKLEFPTYSPIQIRGRDYKIGWGDPGLALR